MAPWTCVLGRQRAFVLYSEAEALTLNSESASLLPTNLRFDGGMQLDGALASLREREIVSILGLRAASDAELANIPKHDPQDGPRLIPCTPAGADIRAVLFDSRQSDSMLSATQILEDRKLLNIEALTFTVVMACPAYFLLVAYRPLAFPPPPAVTPQPSRATASPSSQPRLQLSPPRSWPVAAVSPPRQPFAIGSSAAPRRPSNVSPPRGAGARSSVLPVSPPRNPHVASGPSRPQSSAVSPPSRPLAPLEPRRGTPPSPVRVKREREEEPEPDAKRGRGEADGRSASRERSVAGSSRSSERGREDGGSTPIKRDEDRRSGDSRRRDDREPERRGGSSASGRDLAPIKREEERRSGGDRRREEERRRDEERRRREGGRRREEEGRPQDEDRRLDEGRRGDGGGGREPDRRSSGGGSSREPPSTRRDDGWRREGERPREGGPPAPGGREDGEGRRRGAEPRRDSRDGPPRPARSRSRSRSGSQPSEAGSRSRSPQSPPPPPPPELLVHPPVPPFWDPVRGGRAELVPVAGSHALAPGGLHVLNWEGAAPGTPTFALVAPPVVARFGLRPGDRVWGHALFVAGHYCLVRVHFVQRPGGPARAPPWEMPARPNDSPGGPARAYLASERGRALAKAGQLTLAAGLVRADEASGARLCFECGGFLAAPTDAVLPPELFPQPPAVGTYLEALVSPGKDPRLPAALAVRHVTLLRGPPEA